MQHQAEPAMVNGGVVMPLLTSFSITRAPRRFLSLVTLQGVANGWLREEKKAYFAVFFL